MVYIADFNKEIWPLYTPPLPDEIFTSWLFRLASKHGVEPEIFFKQYFNQRLYFDNNDINIFADVTIIDIILKHTPLKLNKIKQLFLSSYESYVFENADSKEIIKSVQLLRLLDSSKKRNGLLICPSCLSKEIPYFKKKWRLSTSIVCCECNCYLIDSCPGCNTPISHWTSSSLVVSNNNQSKIICKCGYDISLFSSPLVPLKLEIEYQKYVNLTILKGFNDISQYSFTYLKVLILIAFKLRKIIKLKPFQTTLKNIYPDLIFDIEEPFEKWNLLQRRHLLPIAYCMLKKFPDNIKDSFPKGRITRAEFGQLPYWFEKELIFR